MVNRDAHRPAPLAGKLGLRPCGPCPVRELAVCGALAPDELYALNEIVHEASYEPHQTVFQEGDDASGFFIITGGVASVGKWLADGRRQITGFLYPADSFGLTLNGQYTNSVTAVTKLEVCRFPRRRFEALLDRFPKLEARLLGQANNELAVAQDQMVLLGRKSAIERLGSFLLMSSERARRNGLPDNPTWLPMPRVDIGDYLGLSTETTSRMFTKLEELGAISRLTDVKIKIADRDLLQEIAEGE